MNIIPENQVQIYLDYNATTPVLPEIRDAMLPYLNEKFGNPSSVHIFGRESRKAVEDAREKVAMLLGAQPSEIVFTSGGTESDNLALLGILVLPSSHVHLITSKIEHHAVLECSGYLSQNGVEVSYVNCNPDGRIDINRIIDEIRPQTKLISIMHSNNETGVLQPIEEISRLISGKNILLHTDAVQSIGKIPINVQKLGAQLLSLSAHKFGGPKGIGALYVKKGIPINRILHGGTHENNFRPGTEAVPNIVGLGKACELAMNSISERENHLLNLRNHFEKEIFNKIKEIELNGDPTHRLPNTSNIRFKGIEAEALLQKLDMHGVAVSVGSACTAGVVRQSHVLKSMGLSREQVRGSMRFSFGIQTTINDINRAVDILVKCVKEMKT